MEAMLEGFRNYNPFEGVKPDSEWITLSEQKACIVLSDLFLDIEIGEDEIEIAALWLDEFNEISISDIEGLLYYDVFPVVWINLLFPIVWVAFDSAWLVAHIERRRKWRVWSWITGPIHRIAWSCFAEYITCLCNRLQTKMAELTAKRLNDVD